MINYADASLFLQDSLDKQIHIVSEDNTINITNEDIVGESFTLTESLCSEENLIFGSCEPSCIKFTVKNTFPRMYKKWFNVTITLDGSETPFVVGTYRVWGEKPSSDRTTKEITAYDVLYNIFKHTYKRWYKNLWGNSDTMTIKQFRDAWFTRLQSTHPHISQETTTLINDNVVIKKSKKITKPSGKDIFNAICEINGVFGKIGRDGVFHYITLNDSNTTYAINNAQTIEVDYEDYTTSAIDRVEILDPEGEVLGYAGAAADEAENTYTIENNFMLKGLGNDEDAQDTATVLAETLYYDLRYVTFIPFDAEFKGNPCFETGDRISFTAHGSTKTSYILERTMRGIQSLHDDYIAEGEGTYPERSNGFSQKIKDLKNDIGATDIALENTPTLSNGYATPTGGKQGDIYVAMSDAARLTAIEYDGTIPDNFNSPIKPVYYTKNDDGSYNIAVSGTPSSSVGDFVIFTPISLTVGKQYLCEFDGKFSDNATFRGNGNEVRVGVDYSEGIQLNTDTIEHHYSKIFTIKYQHITLHFPFSTDGVFMVFTMNNFKVTPVENVQQGIYTNDGNGWVNALPIAGQDTLGGVKVGNNLVIDNEGKLSVSGAGNVDDVKVDNVSVVTNKIANINTMTGATSQADGAKGLVPQPTMADVGKFLKGDGTWKTPAVSDLTDVAFNNLSNGQILKYNNVNQKWENANESGGGENILAPTPFIYSETEEQVGIWIDGKPLYQKTVNFGAFPNNATKTVSHNISNIDYVVTAIGYGDNGTQFFPIPFVNNDIIGSQVMLYITRSEIVARTSVDRSSFSKCYVTIQYTKTTDTAWQGGFKAYGFSPVIYSDTEREIGVWRDGKPLYQILVEHNEVKNVAYHGDYTFAAGISNVDTCVMCSSIYNPNWDLGHWRQNYPSYYHVNSGNIVLWNEDKSGNSNEIAGVKTILQYTKTTDTAGSGKYTELGVPSVHYDADEHVIGTWFGKPLYQKTIVKNNIIVGYNQSQSIITEVAHGVSNMKENVSLTIKCPKLEISSSDALFAGNTELAAFRVDTTKIYAIGGSNYFGATADRYWYFTIQYTKTTD